MTYTAYPPTFIRQVLDDVAATNRYQAARKHRLPTRTVYRWQDWRDRSGGSWPSDQDVAEWSAAEARREAKTRPIYRRYKRRRLTTHGSMRLPSIGTQRRLRALARLGHTGAVMAVELGVSAARVSQLMRGNRADKYVHAETVESVAEMFDRLAMVIPTGWVADRQRRAAEARGWLPPLAWDSIDDPDEKPRTKATRPLKTEIDPVVVLRVLAGDRMPTTRAEKLAITAAWEQSGRTLKDLEHLMGWRSDRYTVREAS